MWKASIKDSQGLAVMVEGGKKLAAIKQKLRDEVRQGVKASDIETLAVKLIDKAGGKPSFMMVPGYRWATCVNVNAGLVHGIPKSEVVFKKGDLVSIDLGIYYKGFHTDSSFSLGISPSPEIERFLTVGEKALGVAIEAAKPGNKIFDISQAIQETIERAGYSPIKALVGHGIGRNLHEEPKIPCFVGVKREESPDIVPGMTLAIEVMYAQGNPDVELGKDGWTISMRDAKISALCEETVAILRHGPLILTEGKTHGRR